MQLPIPDRSVAGKWLAELLEGGPYIKDPIVLALPRGGVPVAYEISKALQAPLDLILVRKLGAPHYPELAMGAIASGNIKFLNSQVINSYQISQDDIEKIESQERQELERREIAYRGNRPHLSLQKRNVVIVDDGLATGSTMHAAINAVQLQSPNTITVAIPVAPPDTIVELEKIANRVICPFQPHNLSSIGQWYEDFSQVSDEEVKQQLHHAWKQ
ncbi:phosphoribosyltransferase [Thiomicrorhabdus lithotrophica]|uniref:Phosphoribosyltransferase n=1 Tax=Thiomicrorhabdus lithotrophica TaxID=2949997 RepID=A0ABY8C762_9GAMM|nr:phosphoribosyltransferase [Thiomicrorhabdus lithotrophica]WEJ61790.1 phosphoribosyltransferase [Thiomicrorhabdus lithotrophica]